MKMLKKRLKFLEICFLVKIKSQFIPTFLNENAIEIANAAIKVYRQKTRLS